MVPGLLPLLVGPRWPQGPCTDGIPSKWPATGLCAGLVGKSLHTFPLVATLEKYACGCDIRRKQTVTRGLGSNPYCSQWVAHGRCACLGRAGWHERHK
jgi:hypothetical protein